MGYTVNIQRLTFIISAIEHSAVIAAAKFYQDQGLNLLILPVDENGVINLDILNRIK